MSEADRDEQLRRSKSLMDPNNAHQIALYNAARRDKGRCQRCGRLVFKNVRIKYDKSSQQLLTTAYTLSGWWKGRVAPVWAHHVGRSEIEDAIDLVIYCQTCHARVHGDKKYVEKALKEAVAT